MAERLTQPNTRNPSGRIIEVDGVGQVEVGPEFFELPPEQQEQVVAEIVADYGSQTQAAPAQAAEPAQPEAEQSIASANNPLGQWGEGGMRFFTGAAQGAGHVLDNAAELLESGYNNTLGHVFGESHSAEQANQGGGFEGLADTLPDGSPVGRMAGEIGAAALLTRGMGGPVGQGIGTGAIMSEADTPLEFGRDLAIGGAGGYGGELVSRGVRGILAPAIERGAQMLHNAGVRMSPGQYLPALREFEDKSISLPFAGPQIAGARRQSFQDFARAVPRDALETARARLPHRAIDPVPEGVTGQKAVRHAGDQLSAIYEDVIPRLQLRSDPQLVTDLQAVGARLQHEALSDAGQETFNRLLQRGVTGRFRGATATGEEYQAADTYLGTQIARYGRDTDPDAQLIASGLRDIRAHLRNAVTRQNGQLGQDLEAVDEAWSMLVPAEEAASGAVRGYFSPAQYRSALRRGDDRVRRRGMARGEVRGQEFAEAGQDILPAQMPNPSGTASHEAYSLGNTRFYQGLATRMFYNPTTQNFLMRATIGRPAAIDPAARAIAGALEAIPAPQTGSLLAGGATNSLFGF